MLIQITCFPIDKGDSLSDYVAGSLEIIEKSGLKYKMGPMSTAIEGEPEELFDLIKKIHMSMRSMSKRVYTSVTIDDRVGASGRLEYKIASVERKLGREVKK